MQGEVIVVEGHALGPASLFIVLSVHSPDDVGVVGLHLVSQGLMAGEVKEANNIVGEGEGECLIESECGVGVFLKGVEERLAYILKPLYYLINQRSVGYILYFAYVLLGRLVLLLDSPFLDLPEAFNQSQQLLVLLQMGHQRFLILQHQDQIGGLAFGSIYLPVNVLPFLEIDLFIEDSRTFIDQFHIVINLLPEWTCEAMGQYENEEGLWLGGFIYDGNYFGIYIVLALYLLFESGKMLLLFCFWSKVKYFKSDEQPAFLLFGKCLQVYFPEGLKVMFDFFFPFQPRVVYSSRRLFHNLLVLFVAVSAGRGVRGRVVGVWRWRWAEGECVGRVRVCVRHNNYGEIQLVNRFELAG